MAGPPHQELPEKRILIIGAGIAGLSAGVALMKRGARHVTVLEAESLPFSHASGRNAAIYRPVEEDETLVQLAKASLPILRELESHDGQSLLRETGLALLGRETTRLQRMANVAKKLEVPHSQQDGWLGKLGNLTVKHTGPALFAPTAGVLEPHEIGQALLRQLKRRGATIHLNARVESLDETPKGLSVQLTSGDTLQAHSVVLAAGAFAARLAHPLGSIVPLLPLQRHLGVLDTDAPVPAASPVVWQLEPEMYFRAETGGVLVSPCDETPNAAGAPQADISAFEPVSERFESTCGELAAASLRSHWACIRTKAVDGRPVIGKDPNVRGLHWLAGLGGFGMTCGLGAGERLADSLERDEEDPEFSPARFHLPY